MLYLQKFVKIEPTLCRECGTRTVMRYTGRTLVQAGGLISLVIANQPLHDRHEPRRTGASTAAATPAALVDLNELPDTGGNARRPRVISPSTAGMTPYPRVVE